MSASSSPPPFETQLRHQSSQKGQDGAQETLAHCTSALDKAPGDATFARTSVLDSQQGRNLANHGSQSVPAQSISTPAKTSRATTFTSRRRSPIDLCSTCSSSDRQAPSGGHGQATSAPQSRDSSSASSSVAGLLATGLCSREGHAQLQLRLAGSSRCKEHSKSQDATHSSSGLVGRPTPQANAGIHPAQAFLAGPFGDYSAQPSTPSPRYAPSSVEGDLLSFTCGDGCPPDSRLQQMLEHPPHNPALPTRWSSAEDRLLLAAVKKHGGRWDHVTLILHENGGPLRTPAATANRHAKLRILNRTAAAASCKAGPALAVRAALLRTTPALSQQHHHHHVPRHLQQQQRQQQQQTQQQQQHDQQQRQTLLSHLLQQQQKQHTQQKKQHTQQQQGLMISSTPLASLKRKRPGGWTVEEDEALVAARRACKAGKAVYDEFRKRLPGTTRTFSAVQSRWGQVLSPLLEDQRKQGSPTTASGSAQASASAFAATAPQEGPLTDARPSSRGADASTTQVMSPQAEQDGIATEERACQLNSMATPHSGCRLCLGCGRPCGRRAVFWRMGPMRGKRMMGTGRRAS